MVQTILPRYVIKTMKFLNQEHGSMVRIEVSVQLPDLILQTVQVPLRPPMVFLFDPALCEKVS